MSWATRWWVEIKSVVVSDASATVVVRLNVIHPVTKKIEFQDGAGAFPLLRDGGAQTAVPAAETNAVKDAAEKFGKVFGKDISRRDIISYEGLMNQPKKKPGTITIQELTDLYNEKKDKLNGDEEIHIGRIILKQETTSYAKAYKLLNEK